MIAAPANIETMIIAVAGLHSAALTAVQQSLHTANCQTHLGWINVPQTTVSLKQRRFICKSHYCPRELER